MKIIHLIRNKCVYCINIVESYQIYFLDSVVLLVAPAIWITCRYANILGLVFYNSLEKYKALSLLDSVFT